MHEKLFSIQIFQYFRQIPPRVCTLVLFIFRASKNSLGKEFQHFKSCGIAGKLHFILGTELWGSRYEELLCLVKSYIFDIWELHKSKLYGSGTGPLQHRSRPGKDTVCQGKGKFGKLGGAKSCIVVYGSARSSECEAHGPSAMATI